MSRGGRRGDKRLQEGRGEQSRCVKKREDRKRK
jgi:hypothetical protein